MSSSPNPPPSASDGTTGAYSIAGAAELSGMSVPALRLYKRKGLLHPHRTAGGTRRYSDTDIVRLRRIHTLIDAGVNLTGIAESWAWKTTTPPPAATTTTSGPTTANLRAQNHQLSTDNADLCAANTTRPTANDALTTDLPPAKPAAPNS